MLETTSHAFKHHIQSDLPCVGHPISHRSTPFWTESARFLFNALPACSGLLEMIRTKSKLTSVAVSGVRLLHTAKRDARRLKGALQALPQHPLPRHLSSDVREENEDGAAAPATAGGKGSKSKGLLASKMGHYGGLAKARLSSLVVLTTGAGYAIGPAAFDPVICASVCGGTALCAASAGTFNQIFEIDRDASMNRTKKRPLPSGEVSLMEASTFGITTGAAGTGLLLTQCDPTVAAMGLGNIALYAGLYTYSKRVTEWNTWVGSIVGAIPPLMGWMAAEGSAYALEPFALGGLLFLWQFPHFFALSYMHREDYARGGFKMVAVNDPDGTRSADLIWRYSTYMAALPLLVASYELTSWMFAVEASAVNAYFLYLASKFRKNRTNANARKVFLTSLWYLPVVLFALAMHQRQKSKSPTELENADFETVSNAVMERVRVEGSDSSSSPEAEEDRLRQTHDQIREKGKGYCPHEILNLKEKYEDDTGRWLFQKLLQVSPPFCAKMYAESLMKSAASEVADSVGTATATVPVGLGGISTQHAGEGKAEASPSPSAN